jgi:hypothetical protein
MCAPWRRRPRDGCEGPSIASGNKRGGKQARDAHEHEAHQCINTLGRTTMQYRAHGKGAECNCSAPIEAGDILAKQYSRTALGRHFHLHIRKSNFEFRALLSAIALLRNLSI